MAKQRDMTRSMLVVGVLVIAAIFAGLYIGKAGPFSVTATPTPAGGVASGGASSAGVACADTLSTNVKVTQFNELNTTGSESYDQTARLYKVQADGSEALFATLADTVGTATSTNCGDTYRLRLESADGSNARITGVRAGDAAKLSADGKYVEFQAKGAVYNLEVTSPQRGSLKVKAFDLKQNGWVFADDGNAASSYRLSGATFESTTDNATPQAVGVADDMHLRFDVRADGTDVDANDFGIYMLVDANTAVYDEPAVTFAGKSLSDVKGNLDTFESRAFSNYEYVYRIDDSIVDKDKSLDFEINALSGIDPSGADGITVAFAGIGASKQTSGNGMRYASTTDASSPQPTFTLQTFGIAVS